MLSVTDNGIKFIQQLYYKEKVKNQNNCNTLISSTFCSLALFSFSSVLACSNCIYKSNSSVKITQTQQMLQMAIKYNSSNWQWTNRWLHPFNNLFPRTTRVRWHQKGKPFWILMKQEMTGWQWHQLDDMQIMHTSLHTNKHKNPS